MWPAGTGKTLPLQPPLEVASVSPEQKEDLEQPSPVLLQKVVICDKEQVGSWNLCGCICTCIHIKSMINQNNTLHRQVSDLMKDTRSNYIKH